jgi:hypothetical protein
MNSLELWYYQWLLRRRVAATAKDGSSHTFGLTW